MNERPILESGKLALRIRKWVDPPAVRLNARIPAEAPYIVVSEGGQSKLSLLHLLSV
jgi:hypothetical protein